MTRPGPILALRAAIRARLLAAPDLLAQLGGPRVFDEVPRGTDPPYLVFGDARAEEWSSSGQAGARQVLSLVAWSAYGGDAEALSITDAAEAALAGTDLQPPGHRVVLLRILSRETMRPRSADPSPQLRRVTLRLEALTQEA